MRVTGSYRLTLVVVITGVIGTIGGDVSPVVGDTQNVKQRSANRTDRLSGDAALQAAVRSDKSVTVSRRDVEFEHVRALARASGSVQVIVQFDVPNLNALTAASHAAKGPAPITAADGQLSASIAGIRQLELGKLAGTPHTVNRTYASIPFVAMTVSERALDVLRASPGVLGINEDHLADPTLDGTVNITGASTAWSQGFDGSGWYVAILDTGIRDTHDFFAGKDIVQACFARGQDGTPGAGDCPNGLSTDTTGLHAARHHATSPSSTHGSHVAGIATGNDPTRVPPLYGVARGADLIAIQIFSQFSAANCNPNTAPCIRTLASDQIAGLEYVYSLRSTHNIASANMSIGGGQYFDQATCDGTNAGVKAAIDNLRSVGIATVISSGNNSFCDSISGPGCISSAVAVGATQNNDLEASFSNYHAALLDIYAPGVNILSSVNTSDSSYDGTFSGTSMAAPHVAGAWAILKQADPGADVATILSSLQTTGDPVVGRCGSPPSQRRIQIDLALGTRRIKFSQPPDASGEDTASNLDWTDMSPNKVVADDFVSDGRPITAVRWWGSNLSTGSAAATAAANSADQALRTRPEQPTGNRGAPLGSTIINLGAQSLAQIPEEVRSRGVQHWNGGGLGGTAGPGSVLYDNITPNVDYFPPGANVTVGDDMLLTATASELVSYDNVYVFAAVGVPYDVTMELWTDNGAGGAPLALIAGTTCITSGLTVGTTWSLSCGVAPGITLPPLVWMMLTFSTADAGWVISETAETGFTGDLFWLNPPGSLFFFGGAPWAGFAGRILANPGVVCGDGIVGTGEQCDPPNGVTCDGACQLISNPPIDGWLISFHEPLALGGDPSPPLALYFCDAANVAVAATSHAACDAHPVRQYEVDLVDCCLIHSYPDSRNGSTPGQPGTFLETACFNYDIDIQAVVGHTFLGTGGLCTTEVPTGNAATIDFWGWHTTGTEHGLGPALRSVVSMDGPTWLYGPWSPLTPTCSQPNMAFQLLTDVSGNTLDCNENRIPDACDISDCPPNDLACQDCQPDGIPDSCQLAGHDANGNGIPDGCDPPGNIVWNSNLLSPDRTTRSLKLKVTSAATGTPLQDAIKVMMVDLQTPNPPNLVQFPPPNFSGYETASCSPRTCVGGAKNGATCVLPAPVPTDCPAPGVCTAAVESNGCARWVGRPGTFLEDQDVPLGASFKAARLQCSPYYHDWVTETASGPIAVVGAEIAPSSEYSVQTYGASCKGAEAGCANVSAPVTMFTRRSGDVEAVFNPPGTTTQPDAIDVAQVVAKVKSLPGALVKSIAQLQPNLPELNANVSALDIVAVVDGAKGFAYAFSGPCPCPSTVKCGPAVGSVACATATPCVTAFGPGALCVKTCVGGTNAGEPCIDSTKHCPGGGVCGNGGMTPGFCRDRCGRCTP